MSKEASIAIAISIAGLISQLASLYWQIKSTRAQANPATKKPKEQMRLSGRIKNLIKTFWLAAVSIALPAAGLAVGLFAPIPLSLPVIILNSVMLTFALVTTFTVVYFDSLFKSRTEDLLQATASLSKSHRSVRRSVKALRELQGIYVQFNSSLHERLNELDRREREKKDSDAT